MDFSDEQKKAIGNSTDNILVSAAAGSGKTTMMVERIIRGILSGNLSIDRVLVVTFTVDAAQNMLGKIENSLTERLDQCKRSGDKDMAGLLSEQLDLLPNAYVQTFDSFCARCIREKGYTLADDSRNDIYDSGNIVLDGNELELLLDEAAKLSIEQSYQKGNPLYDSFLMLTERFGDGRNDDSLAGTLVSCYNSLRSLPDYLDAVDSFVSLRKKRDNACEIMYLDGGKWDIVDEIVEKFRCIRDAIAGIGGTKDYLDRHKDVSITSKTSKGEKIDFRAAIDSYIGDVISYLDGVTVAYDNSLPRSRILELIGNYGSLSSFNFRISHGKADKAETDRALEPLVALRKFTNPATLTKEYNSFVIPGDYSFLLNFNAARQMQYQKEGTQAIEAFADLLHRTDANYSALKSAVHGMDFADQEHAAYLIMKNDEAADFYREKFIEIFIDEYQDNTRLQDRIIERFARSEGNVFRVGDIKQSIYKFRNADPEIFDGKMRNLKLYREDSGKGEKGELLNLSRNFRSTDEILAFVNSVFRQLMTADGAEIEYDDNQKFNAPDSKEDRGRHDLPKIVIVNRADQNSSDSEETDGKSADNKDKPDSPDTDDSEDISHLMPDTRAVLTGIEKEIREYSGGLSDICILTTTKNKAQTVTDYLNSRGLPAAGRVTTGIFEDIDIHRIINLIVCLGNEYRDEYLMSVFISGYMFSNFTVRELASIQAYVVTSRPDLREAALILRLRFYCENAVGDLSDRVAGFINVFDDMRMQSQTMDVDDIVELIYKRTGIKATMRAEGKDVNRLTFLKDWLSSNFKRFGCDISGIAGELENMKIVINTKANIEVTDSDKNKITVMNVHKSKGLEFPFVILALQDGRDDKTDTVSPLMFDKNDGFIIDNYDYENIMRSKSVEQFIYGQKIRLAGNAEKLRLLYVALTRAKEKLTIVTYSDKDKDKVPGFIADASKKASKNGSVGFGRDYWLSGSGKMGFQLMSGIIRAKAAEPIRALTDKDVSDPDSGIVDFEDIRGNRIDDGFTVSIIDGVAYSVTEDSSGINSAGKEAVTEGTDSFDSGRSEESEREDHGGLDDYDAEYPYSEQIQIPFKVSVTGIENGRVKETTHIDMELADPDRIDRPGLRGLTSASKGTILHRIMRFVDYDRIKNDPAALDGEVESLISEGFFKEYGAENVRRCKEEFASGITGFAGSSICAEMIKAESSGEAECEKPIVFAVPSTEGAKRTDFALVQGVIDLIYQADGGKVIIDYKTDRLDGMTEDERAAQARERHGAQLGYYSAACEASGSKVKAKFVYLVRYSQFVEV